jgi:outer membrane protein OmpU
MRKILLATTALVGVAFAGAAHAAATSPISLNVGGYTDFVAGFYHESSGVLGDKQADHAFETEYKINFDAVGKGTNGIEYGANISLWNGEEATTAWSAGANGVTLNSAYVWLSGAFGKALFGDEHGASDLFVYAPTVGEGQIDGRYLDFVSATTLHRAYASGIDNTEHSTKITYYTPKVGNDMNKVQLGVSYTPNMYNYGQGGQLLNSNLSTSPYQDVIEAALAYHGNFHPVNVVVSAQIINGDSSDTPVSSTTLGGAANTVTSTPLGVKAMDFTSWGLGAQVNYSGFTIGGSYVDEGSYMATQGQDKGQDVFTLGGKYEFDKVGVGVSWLNGEGYDNLIAGGTSTVADTANYVSRFNALGAGATYTWFPGLSSNIDGVMFSQKVTDQSDHNDGYVLLLSQRLAF